MSSSARSTDREGRVALGSRENFWGDTSDDSESTDAPTDPTATFADRSGEATRRAAPTPNRNIELAEYLEHQIRKHYTTPICPEQRFAPPNRGFDPDVAAALAWLFADAPDDPGSLADLDHDPLAIHRERRAVELTDPEARPPKRAPKTFGEQPYRQQRRRTRINPDTGYVNGPVLKEQPMDEFLEMVRDWLTSAPVDLETPEIESYVNDARELKSRYQERTDGWVIRQLTLDLLDPYA